MDTDSFSVPVSLLRQYAFCPRIPFFLSDTEPAPTFSVMGKAGVGVS